MAIINTAGEINWSKHRNQKSKSLSVRDLAGNKIQGSVEGHYRSIQHKIQERYDIKKTAFELLTLEQIKELYNNPVKPTICSKTDKLALADVYFDKQYQIYDELTIEQLKEIDSKDFNEVEKLAVERCLELKELKNRVENEKNSETIHN